MFTYKYPRPALTTDALILGYDNKNKELKILLIKRKNEPFKNQWAIPGGFVDMNETIEQCAKRELQEETGLSLNNLEQLTVASKIDRDPRGRTISTVFWAIIPIVYNLKANDDAADLQWFNCNNLPKLAFDHDEIIKIALDKLKFRLENYHLFYNFFENQQIRTNIEQLKKICK